MLAGVTIVDPAATWIEAGVEIEPDVDDPPVHRAPRRDARSRPAPRSARTSSRRRSRRRPRRAVRYLARDGARERAKAGTFVEIKNSQIGARTKVPHLSYIGDAEIGEDTNVAAGNITANFPHEPGLPKGRTTIGSNVRTGVDNAFVAPVERRRRRMDCAGSVITDDVPPGALADRRRARRTRKDGSTRRMESLTS